MYAKLLFWILWHYKHIDHIDDVYQVTHITEKEKQVEPIRFRLEKDYIFVSRAISHLHFCFVIKLHSSQNVSLSFSKFFLHVKAELRRKI